MKDTSPTQKVAEGKYNCLYFSNQTWFTFMIALLDKLLFTDETSPVFHKKKRLVAQKPNQAKKEQEKETETQVIGEVNLVPGTSTKGKLINN